MKITEHIYFYPNSEEKLVRPSNTIIILGKEKQVIIDPGSNIDKRFENLVKEMEEDGLDINKTNEVWLTHSHPDHSQAIYHLFKRFGEQRLVRCHPWGKSRVSVTNLKKNFLYQERKKAGRYWRLLIAPEDRKKSHYLAAVSPALDMIKEGISKFWRKITNIKPFFDKEVVGISPIRVQVIFLAGHTPDEIGFWIAEEKVLILGDLVCIYQYEDGKIDSKLILNNFYANLDHALESLERMKNIKEKEFFGVFSRRPEILLTAHSAPVKGKENIQKIFDQLILRIDSYRNIAREFIGKYADLKEVQLVNKFAKELPADNFFKAEAEKRFLALAILKSLGVIE